MKENNSKLKFIDSHCHLDFPQLLKNLEKIINLSKQFSIKKIITICTKLSHLEKIINISKQYENIWFTAGIHPHEASYQSNAFSKEKLYNIVSNLDKCVGIGEAGIDNYYKKSSIEDQKKSFLIQIDVARLLDKPIVIHSRDSDEEMIEILVAEYSKGSFRGVMHCFTGGKQLYKTALSIGLHISFSGIVTFKKSTELQEFAKQIPANKYLIETDAPYLSPEPLRGKINCPSNIYYIAKFLANLRNVSINTISNESYSNTCKIFNGIGE